MVCVRGKAFAFGAAQRAGSAEGVLDPTTKLRTVMSIMRGGSGPMGFSLIGVLVS